MRCDRYIVGACRVFGLVGAASAQGVNPTPPLSVRSMASSLPVLMRIARHQGMFRPWPTPSGSPSVAPGRNGSPSKAYRSRSQRLYLISEGRKADEVAAKLTPAEIKQFIETVQLWPDLFPRGTLAAVRDGKPTSSSLAPPDAALVAERGPASWRTGAPG